MLRPHAEAPRVTLAIVSLGVTDALVDCLAALESHESRHAFSIVWVCNDPGREAAAPMLAMPDAIHQVHLDTNLGWAGGLHAARAATDAEYLVWVQDDMVVLPGWLDALVDAADAHPEFVAFGSRSVDSDGRPTGFAAGMVSDDLDVGHWNDTDRTATDLPTTVTRFEWITSKGMLTRVAAWDAIGGADPGLFPLNHVDKDFSIHLRSHGYSVALVPDARLEHLGSASAPSSFRLFLTGWAEARFNERWMPVARALEHDDRDVDHECLPWAGGSDRAAVLDAAARASTAAAARMTVPLARWFNGRLAASAEQLHAQLELQAKERENFGVLTTHLDAMRSSVSWRITAPLRWVRRLTRRSR